MVSMETSLRVCIEHRQIMAMKLMDTSPLSGALFGITVTGPEIKNLPMPNAPVKALIIKLRIGRPSALKKLIS